MSKFELTNHIPAPTTTRGGAPEKYPFAQMDVGVSFGVVIPEGKTAETLCSRLNSAVQRWRKADESRKAIKFKVAEHEGEVRVWRTA